MWISYLADVPSGATIIIVAAMAYLISMGLQKFRKKKAVVSLQ